MRKSVAMMVAVLAAASSTLVTIVPAGAVAMGPPVSPGQVQLVGGRDPDGWNHGRRWGHHRWDDDNWYDGRRHHRHHRHHFFPQAFFYNFPFAFAPQPRYRHDCFRGRNGRIYCAR